MHVQEGCISRSHADWHLVSLPGVALQVLPEAYGGEAAMIPIEDAVHARLVQEGLERARSSPKAAAADGAQDAEGRLTRAGRCIHAGHAYLHCLSQVKWLLILSAHPALVSCIYATRNSTLTHHSILQPCFVHCFGLCVCAAIAGIPHALSTLTISSCNTPAGNRVCVCRAVQRWGSATADFARHHNPVNAIVHSKTLNRVKGWRPFNRDQAVLYVDEATSTKGDADEDNTLSPVESGVGQLVMYLMPQVFIVAIFRKAQQVLQFLVCAYVHAS